MFAHSIFGRGWSHSFAQKVVWCKDFALSFFQKAERIKGKEQRVTSEGLGLGNF